MKISVIIPCRNEKRHITTFLDSLRRQELDPGCQLEVLVADGESDDGTREMLEEYIRSAPGVCVIDNPGRIVSTGLNAAIEASTGEVVIRMDAHTTYAKDYIRQCLAVLGETGADAVGGAWLAQGRGSIGKAIAAAFQSRICAGGAKGHDPNYEGEVDLVYLGCFRRSVFEKAGLFDPQLVRNQDDEFNFRMRRLGLRIWQSRRIHSFYAPRDSITALFRQYLQYGFWRVAVIRKHRVLASWRHLVPPLFVTSILLFLALMAMAAALGTHQIGVWAGAILAAELAAYFLTCAAATLAFTGKLDAAPLTILPVAMAVYHVAYGLGFLIGIMKPVKSGEASQPRLLTSLTR